MSVWVRGARPRTLGAAVVPVAVGTAAARHADPLLTVLLLVVALGMQIGVNYANDYSDGVRGVDARRVGPARLTASGLASPRAVVLAATVALAAATAAGTVLSLIVDRRLVAVGVASIVAAVGYSGGPMPYARLGLGELSVFAFFGPVATCGTAYVQGRLDRVAWVSSVPVGLLTVAILVANNLRDIETDAAAGKRTLAVRIGDARTRTFYRCLLVLALALMACVGAPRFAPVQAVVAVVAAPLFGRAIRAARTTPVGALLGETARLHLGAGALLAGGLALR